MATESIYNLIPQPVPPPVKEALYRSKHPGDKPTTFSTFGLTGTSKPGYVNVAGAEEATKGGQHEYKKPFATMGKDGNAVPPTEVLKKKTGGGGGAYAAAMGLSDQSECCLMPFCARECLRRAAPRWRRRGQSCRWTHALGVDLSASRTPLPDLVGAAAVGNVASCCCSCWPRASSPPPCCSFRRLAAHRPRVRHSLRLCPQPARSCTRIA